jgi:hypothetical protein
MQQRGPAAMIGAVAAAVVLVVLGILIQIGALASILGANHHTVSTKAIACWGLAVVALIGASFLRPRAS